MFHQQQRTTLAFSVLSGLFAALSGFLGKVTFDPGLVIAVSILNVRVSANKFDLFSGAAEQVKPVKHVLHRNSKVLLQRNF